MTWIEWEARFSQNVIVWRLLCDILITAWNRLNEYIAHPVNKSRKEKDRKIMSETVAGGDNGTGK